MSTSPDTRSIHTFLRGTRTYVTLSSCETHHPRKTSSWIRYAGVCMRTACDTLARKASEAVIVLAKSRVIHSSGPLANAIGPTHPLVGSATRAVQLRSRRPNARLPPAP